MSNLENNYQYLAMAGLDNYQIHRKYGKEEDELNSDSDDTSDPKISSSFSVEGMMGFNISCC